MTISRFTHLFTTDFAWMPVISADGRYVATAGYNPTYLFGGTAAIDKAAPLLIDLDAGTAQVIKTLQGGLSNNAYRQIYDIDADGSTILYPSYDVPANWPAGSPNPGFYLEETNGSALKPMPSYGEGSERLMPSWATLAADGVHVVVVGSQWAANGTYLGDGVFVEADLRTGAVTPLKIALPRPETQPHHLGAIDVSADGSKVLFETSGTDAATTKSVYSLLVHDVANGLTQQVDTNTANVAADGFTMPNFSISGNGRYVAFVSTATNLSADSGTSGAPTLYVKDLSTGAIRAASTDSAGHGGQFAELSLISQAISDDGRYVVFESPDNYGYEGIDSRSPAYIGGSPNSHVFVKDMQTGAVALVNSTPETVGLAAHGAAISGNGQVIVFQGIEWGDGAGKGNQFHTYALPLPVFKPVAADDVVKGAAGPDTQAAGLGNDTYTVDDKRDIVIEYADAGTDTIRATVSYVLPANVENLVLDGQNGFNGTGNELANTLTGTAGDNRLSGAAGDDLLVGGGGSDTLDGGAGHDTARFAGKVSDCTITGGDTVTVRGGSGTSTLKSVELLKFDDGVVTFETGGTTGQAFRLYQAAFDRTPDLPGLGYWMAQMEHGASLPAVAEAFIASKEFKDMFGAAPANASFVDLLYHHVLHRDADKAGAAYWTDALDRHVVSMPDVLVEFSESKENQDALVGVMKNGVAYLPFGG